MEAQFQHEFLAGEGVDGGRRLVPDWQTFPAPPDRLANITGHLGPQCPRCSGYGITFAGIRDGVRGGCAGSVGRCADCLGTGVRMPDPRELYGRLGSLETQVQTLREENDAQRRYIEELRRNAPKASRQFWRETIWWSTTNGTTFSTTTTETILMPNVTIPANYMSDGRALQVVLMGKLSNIVTTPGTITFRVKWGSTTLAASSAISLNTTAQTDVMWRMQFEVVTRANGASGSLLAMGLVQIAAQATQAPNFMGSAGGGTGNTPAAVASDLTADTAFGVTAQFSVSNAGNAITGMQYLGDSLN